MAQSKQQSPVLFTEIFDIVPENLPALIAYELNVRSSHNPVRSGRKLADRLMRKFGGHWVWTDDLIVTDTPQTPEIIGDAIRDIRIKESEAFKDLTGINLIENWTSSPRARADFVAGACFSTLAVRYSKRFCQSLIWVEKRRLSVNSMCAVGLLMINQLFLFLLNHRSFSAMISKHICRGYLLLKI